ncbi:hypothetical protein KVH15_37140 [Streptomyces olivaceus]|uniref:MarR family transcriptional regulator n=1 Tax=Streptomyces violaceolatus TaxID=67378 RepID=A0ABN3TJE1_9ACTN|nr:hypothetical protein [Streptomyces olivaceus]MBZ6086598.1 hypothetical protein [Streptomyces olivaceus]
MAATRRAARRLELVDTTTGEVVERKQRVPHAFDGKGYTLEGHGAEVPNFSLNLSGTEWDVLDWMKQHGGCANPVRLEPSEVAPLLCSTPNTVKAAVARLLKLNLMLRIGGPRSGTYQLNPRRFWEGSGEAHVKACTRMDPPAVAPDAKALATALKAAQKATDTARDAAEAADEAEELAPDSKLAEKTRATAAATHASAILAVETAVNLGAQLPVQLRRFLQEAAK